MRDTQHPQAEDSAGSLARVGLKGHGDLVLALVSSPESA